MYKILTQFHCLVVKFTTAVVSKVLLERREERGAAVTSSDLVKAAAIRLCHHWSAATRIVTRDPHWLAGSVAEQEPLQ